MNLYADFAERIRHILIRIGLPDPVNADGRLRFVVEPPREAAHGDLATNAAMVLSKDAGRKPRDLAADLAGALADDPDVASVEVAGPGFINIRLERHMFAHLLRAIVETGRDYGRSTLGGAAPINVEYVSANPTGPMHVGHCRGAVFGDALASLLAFAGYDVTREYYINDAGVQVDVLARSAFLRYREALGEDVGAIPEGLYPGDYLKPVGAALAERHGESLKALPEAEWLPLVRAFTIDAMMVMIREDLDLLAVHHDVFSSERALVSEGRNRVAEAIDDLRSRGLIYEGRLAPPKGQLPDDWEDREQTLFRSTDFGDDVDRALMKSDGTYTYFASDIAYHYDKYLRGFRLMIDVLGADHGGYVKRMQAAVKAITRGEGGLDVKLCQLVKLFRAGEPVRMSKRSGDFVTLRDVVEEVGRDAVRFMMLYRKNDAPLDFDFQKVTEQTRDNPVFYVQYAHARCSSVFRQVAEEIADLAVDSVSLKNAALDRLADEGELALIAKLGEWPRLIEAAAEAHEPHRVAFYLYDLASALHGHWNRGKEKPDLRFINAHDRELTQARLALVYATAQVLAGGLGLLGVSAPEEMR
ncbi:arginine--tRNA ligase [Segnochrobactrum spirostomi]|uniref:Arginine--tRNA ligase n=1 Tax=Segnochrobactrum spirostomi TaxID=2608987 RepID=A0A6A7Y5G1_9HYPH|nr:arginine--tRNA ligase [Segnochrobactrum spirostomi]MQT14443.1 arginine--tRNA ligase [Segnochrobactrum spirostomi]